MSKIRFDQIDFLPTDFEGVGQSSRQPSLKAGAVSESKLGFSWETVSILASAFSFDGTRSNYTLITAASSDGNVLDNSELLRNGLGGSTRVTTTANAGEWSLSGTTLSVHGDITSTGDGYELRYVVGTASGAKFAGNLLWHGLYPQDPLATESDYFTDGTLDPKWTEWDVPANQTVTEDVHGLQLVQPTSAGSQHAGIIQAAPSDDEFIVTARLRVSGHAADSQVVEVIAGEDLSTNPSTDGFYTASLVAQTARLGVENAVWSNYNTYSTSVITDEFATNECYARIFVDRPNTNVRVLFSSNGRDWIQVGPDRDWSTGVVTSIDYIGIATNNSNSGNDLTGRCDMFRVDITDDPYLPVGGYVGVGGGLTAGLVTQGMDLDTGAAAGGTTGGSVNNVPCMSFPLGSDAYWRSNLPKKLPTYTGGDLTFVVIWGTSVTGMVGETVSLSFDVGFGNEGETIGFTATQLNPVINMEGISSAVWYRLELVIPESEVDATADTMSFRILRKNSDATYANSWRIFDIWYEYQGAGV